MLWLVNKGSSHQIVSCNIHKEKDRYQLWVERISGKTLKIAESKNPDDVMVIKGAIDFAIREGHKTLEME